MKPSVQVARENRSLAVSQALKTVESALLDKVSSGTRSTFSTELS